MRVISSSFCTMWSSFWECGLKIPGIPKQKKKNHIFFKTMPKVACWPNELRWIMVFENNGRWCPSLSATEISENASCGSQRCLYLPSLAYELRSCLVRSGEKDLVLFNHKAWYPWKNALNAKTSLTDPSVGGGEVKKTYGFDYSVGYFSGQVRCWFTHRE